MLSSADQDYIKAIYSLQTEGGPVTTSSLAALLGVTSASVSGMLAKLSRAGMVRHNRYRGVRLTERGRLAALKVLRRHRLIELFLVETLGLPWDKVHQEAENLEHVISDQLEQRMDELLGHPEFDPHGAPIPSLSGLIADSGDVRLGEAKPPCRGRISRVSDSDPELLRYLSRLGLVPGANVTLHEVLGFDGTVVVQVGKRRHHVSPAVAASVWITEHEGGKG